MDLCNGQSCHQPPFLHPAESCTSATLPQKYPRYSDSSELFFVGVVSSSKAHFHSFPMKADNHSIYVVILNLECKHMTCNQSLIGHDARQVSVCKVLCLTVCMTVSMSVPFCILCMHKLFFIFVCMSVIYHRNRCTEQVH